MAWELEQENVKSWFEIVINNVCIRVVRGCFENPSRLWLTLFDIINVALERIFI